MTAPRVEGRRVVVVGGGVSGRSAARLLARHGARVTVSDLDTTLVPPADLRTAGIVFECGEHRPETFAAADLVVVSPGVAPDLPVLEAARSAGIPVVGELELASRWLPGRIIAITGTKGKSTTTALVAHLLRAGGLDAREGGNIGIALSDQVDDAAGETVHVVEASSFQLELTDTFHPWIAVCLNVSPDHLDRHHSFEEYVAAKARIFANQRREDRAVINADDEGARGMAGRTAAQVVLYGLDADVPTGVTVAGRWIVRRTTAGEDPIVEISRLRLVGRHLLADALAAVAVALLAGVRADRIAEAIGTFHGIEHVLEPAGEVRGVRFVNDTKATNVASARQSVETFGSGLVVILGGRFKGGDISLLGEPLRERHATVVAIGEARARFREMLARYVPVREAESMEEAVRAAFTAAPPGSTVLLAPACASFDMFRNYAERGRAFKAAVQRLKEEYEDAREP